MKNTVGIEQPKLHTLPGFNAGQNDDFLKGKFFLLYIISFLFYQ